MAELNIKGAENPTPQSELEKQIDSLQHKIGRLKGALDETLVTTERERLEKEIQSREETLSSLQGQLQQEEDSRRRSTRTKILTPKMLELHQDEAKKDPHSV